MKAAGNNADKFAAALLALPASAAVVIGSSM
jgi:hypothetical protein